MGFYPQNGLIPTGRYDQTSRLEVKGTYNATSGVSLGTRVVAHRIYGTLAACLAGTAWTSGTNEWYSMNSGHVVIWSADGDGTTANPIWPDVTKGSIANGATKNYDDALRATFARIENLDWGGQVTKITNSSGGIVAGSEYGGTKPTEMIWTVTEPNINISATKGTAYQFAGMMKHIATVYDNWFAANRTGPKHIKFMVTLSNPSGQTSVNTVSANFYGIGTGSSGNGDPYDITKTSASPSRPMDYAGWDIYYPWTQNKKNAGPVPATSSGEISFGSSSKYASCHTWTLNNMPTNTHDVIPEYAIRMPTSPGGTSTGPDPTWPATWYGTVKTYLNNNRLPNGDHPVKYMCQYVAASNLKNRQNGGGSDNSIIPDQTTFLSSFENGYDVTNNTGVGISLRPAWTAYHDFLVDMGNPTLTGSNGVTPTLNTPAAPAAGATQVNLTWTTNAANASYNVYKDGSATPTQTGITTGGTTVYASSGSLPQTHTYTVTGVGTNGVESAVSNTVTVNYTPQVGTPPGTPAQPTVPAADITTGSALFQTVAGTGTTTGYTWIIDGVTASAPTSVSPSYQASGLSPGSHTVAVQAYNQYGPSATTAATSFTIPNAPDGHAPSDPGTPVLNTGTLAYNNVDLSWTASTDPLISGEVQSGLLGYPLYRSTSPDFSTATLIGTPSTNAYKDKTPSLISGTASTDNYYWVTAIDNARNQTVTPIGPLKVTVPAAPTLPNPTPVINFDIPSGTGQVGQSINLDGSQSVPGSGGAIVSYSWDFGDGTTAQNSTSAGVQHIWLSSAQFLVTLTVTDASGKTGTVTVPYIVAPSADSLFTFIQKAKLISKTFATADQMNQLIGALDSGLLDHEGRIADGEDNWLTLGSPVTPARHGLIYTSIVPEAVGGSKPVVAGTAYVIRAYTLAAASFSNFLFHHVNTSSLTGLANTFIAVYDIDGNLVSPSGANTDQSAAIIAKGNGVNVLPIDGGPYTFPLGTDALQANPVNQCYIYFCFGTVGANVPTISTGSSYKFAINFGLNLGPVTPTAATVDQMPIFATAQNGPTAALTPPATLGQLTSFTDSLLIGLG